MPTTVLRKKIGVAIVSALPPDTIVWDTDVKGFCARRQRSETVSYLIKTRVEGRIRWFTIGRHGQPWTPDAARKRAMAILVNPAIAEKEHRDQPLTFNEVADMFLEDHSPRLKPKSVVDYRCSIDTHLRPAFGSIAITKIAHSQVSMAHARWKTKPRAANLALAVMSKMMTWCEMHELRPRNSNPCKGVKRYRETRRQTFLQPDELSRLGAALDKAETHNLVSPYPLAAIRLLIFTGARLAEILTLRWTFIDFDRRTIFLPDSKTGAKPVPLNDEAIAILKALPRHTNNPHVIVGQRGQHLINLQKPWNLVRRLADLDHVRLHDLRHTFASVAVNSGASLPIIGRALGHTQPQTTARYAHLTDDPVRDLAQATGQRLATAMKQSQ
jgi:integrase